MGDSEEKIAVFNDEILDELVWDFFKNCEEDFVLLMQKLYEHKEQIDPHGQIILFPLLGNIFHTMTEIAKSNTSHELSLENEMKYIPLNEALDLAQMAVLSDPKFESSIRDFMPAIFANQILNRGE